MSDVTAGTSRHALIARVTALLVCASESRLKNPLLVLCITITAAHHCTVLLLLLLLYRSGYLDYKEFKTIMT
jgi:hypothetical protein